MNETQVCPSAVFHLEPALESEGVLQCLLWMVFLKRIWMVNPQNDRAKLRYLAKHVSFSWDMTSMTHSSNDACTTSQELTQFHFETLDEN